MTATEAPAGFTRVAMGRVGGYLYLVASVVTVVSIVFPHSRQANVTGFWALAVATALVAAVLLGWPERLPAWSLQVLMAYGSVLIALSLFFNGERDGGPAAINEALYLWIALYSGYFFARRQIVLQLAVCGATYAAALAAIAPGPVAYTRWFIVMGMAAVAAVLVHGLRRRNEALVAGLHEAARTDPLTGLLNRQGFEERFELELERARRSAQPLALVLGDLDRFKQLNDHFGHQAGDSALTSVGTLLSGACRRIDTAARIGGEEFALLLPGTGATGALELAERVRRQVTRVLDGDGMPLTVSFGVVEFPVHAGTRETLVHAADQALYKAKALGRDRSVVPRFETADVVVHARAAQLER